MVLWGLGVFLLLVWGGFVCLLLGFFFCLFVCCFLVLLSALRSTHRMKSERASWEELTMLSVTWG